jgi:hypothetical protein
VTNNNIKKRNDSLAGSWITVAVFTSLTQLKQGEETGRDGLDKFMNSLKYSVKNILTLLKSCRYRHTKETGKKNPRKLTKKTHQIGEVKSATANYGFTTRSWATD